MLKRQRPISPSPSIPDIPLVSSEPTSSLDRITDIFARDTKRRRTAAPVLDGRRRGWGTSGFGGVGNDEDDTEGMSQDEEECEEDVDQDNRQRQEATGEYKSTNSFLHDLHQRRQLVSSPSPSPSLHIHSRTTPSSKYPLPLDPSPMTKSSQPPRSCSQSNIAERHKCGMSDSLLDPGDRMDMEEVQSVKQRYEDTNKWALTYPVDVHSR